MQFLFSPVWGRWSDRIGRKPIILVGLMGSCLSYLGLALSTTLPLLFLARIIGGIAGANIPTAQAYIADVTTPENRARGMGMVGAAFGLGFIFGPALGGVLSRISPCNADVVCIGALLRQFRRCVVPAARSRDRPMPRPGALGRMEAFQARIHQADSCCFCWTLYFIVTLAFLGLRRRRSRSSANRGSATRRRP
jgi:MFS family permease